MLGSQYQPGGIVPISVAFQLTTQIGVEFVPLAPRSSNHDTGYWKYGDKPCCGRAHVNGSIGVAGLFFPRQAVGCLIPRHQGLSQKHFRSTKLEESPCAFLLFHVRSSPDFFRPTESEES